MSILFVFFVDYAQIPYYFMGFQNFHFGVFAFLQKNGVKKMSKKHNFTLIFDKNIFIFLLILLLNPFCP